MEPEIEEKIWNLIESGNTRKIEKFVDSYLSEEHPLAIYAIACTSFKNESEEQFSERYVTR